MPISRKDAALNSLVNFSDLKQDKTSTSALEEEKQEEKPIYIK